MKTPCTRYFDGWARRYDTDMAAYHYAEPALMFEALQPYIKGAASPTLLDIGIGTGLSALPFRTQIQGIHITGVDSSNAMLDICGTKKIADVLMNCDVTTGPLPFADQSFDFVMAAGIVEYLPDPSALFTEIFRVLRAGGVAAISYEPQETKPLYKKGILNGVIKETGHLTVIRRVMPRSLIPRSYKKYLFAPVAIGNLLTKSGFSIRSDERHPVYRWSGHQTAFVHNVIIIHKSV